MAQEDISREVARQAAHWLMLLHSEEANEQHYRACEQWRRACPEHERAWQKVERVQQQLGLLPLPLAKSTLGRERRQLMKTLLVLAAVAPAGYAGWQWAGGHRHWLADLHTATGERRTQRLEDGSRLSLNSNSAVDLRFDHQQRLIILHHGELLIDSGKDPLRPLRIRTAEGTLQALGTRFSVRRFETPGATRLTVFEGAVRAQPDQAAPTVVSAGQQLTFDRAHLGPLSAASETLASWVDGRLIVEDWPLQQFLDELARYRHGWLRQDLGNNALRISGTFQLDNTDAILAALPETLPVDVQWRTRYWVRVSTR